MDVSRLCMRCMREAGEDAPGDCCPYCGYSLRAEEEVRHYLRPRSILYGKYLVGKVLGEGGFGITYIGLDLNLETRVAIKEFYPNGHVTREGMTSPVVTTYSGNSQQIVDKWREKFTDEARRLAKCSYLSGIVGVRDFFQENNTVYIVMEYLEGVTLKDYVESRGGKLPLSELMDKLFPVMQSLEEVHKNGLIHRDISPDNLMISSDGHIKLLDFGAARDYGDTDEKSLSVLLKPGYAPEEQYRTKGRQGPWTDVYALCATIYRCITGVKPPESMERLRQDELVRPSRMGVAITPAAEAVLLKGLSVYAEQRYQTVGELYWDFQRTVQEAAAAETAAAEITGFQPGVQPEMPYTPAAYAESRTEGADRIRTHSRTETGDRAKAGSKAITGNKNQNQRKTDIKIPAICGASVLLLFIVLAAVLQGGKGSQAAGETAAMQSTLALPTDTTDAEAENAETPESASSPASEEKEVETHTYQYEILIADMTWEQAFVDCIERGGHLVTIETKEEYEILAEQLDRPEFNNVRFWVGGERTRDSYDYYWVNADGTAVGEPINGLEYWLDGEPTYSYGDYEEKSIVMFYRESAGSWKFMDVANDVIAQDASYKGRLGYICEY